MTHSVTHSVTPPVPPPVASLPHPARLDYLRGCLNNIPSGVESLPSDNIFDILQPFFENAIQKGARAYIFGELRPDVKKINQIHMNQGSVGRFENENAAGQDGGVLLQFPDGHWESLFIAFNEQGSQTNANGQSIGPNIGSLVEYCEDNPVTTVTDARYTSLGITTLLYPYDKDRTWYLSISNIAKEEMVDLTGWRISSSQSERAYIIKNIQLLPGGGRSRFGIPPTLFAGRSGTIYLRKRGNEVVDMVHYCRAWELQSGRIQYFGRSRES
ncbi:hypothetical protein F52700_5685 [Fusarium sp. NRRL 52700]|nr:hypothetical protein F52700_5685 [Fusarium sp. NRRL 52700]